MSEPWPFGDLPREHYGVIYVDPPTRFETWSEKGKSRSAENHYPTLTHEEIRALPVADLTAENCVLFLWFCWPQLKESLLTMEAWGFQYKTCAFSWTKADAGQLEMFQDDIKPAIGNGYWTRANNESCLLGVRGEPKRLNAGVRMAIIEPRREHSRKPDCVYDRIERLVAGPFVELFARQRRPGWASWGNETDKFRAYDGNDDFAKSLEEGYRAIRERVAAGGPGWIPK
jgi:N6-adenosine-specific RNA methylase IME4